MVCKGEFRNAITEHCKNAPGESNKAIKQMEAPIPT